MSDLWAQRMMDAAYRLRQVEDAYYQAVKSLNEVKHACHLREGELMADGKVNMKNEDTRRADLWKLAKEERKAVLIAEAQVDALKPELHYRQNLFEATCIAAKLQAEE